MKFFIPLLVCCYFAALEYAIGARVPQSPTDFAAGLLFMVFFTPVFLGGAIVIAILAKYSGRFRRAARVLPVWGVGLMSLIGGISGYFVGHVLVSTFGAPAF